MNPLARVTFGHPGRGAPAAQHAEAILGRFFVEFLARRTVVDEFVAEGVAQ